MTNALEGITKGSSLPFSFNRDGLPVDGYTCQIQVKQKTGDEAIIDRLITSEDNLTFPGFLKSSETILLDVGLWYLTAKLSNVSTNEREEIPVRFDVSETWSINSKVADVTFSPPSGTFETSVAVTLATVTVGATIHFTTDGTNPDKSSQVFTVPIVLTDVNSPHTIKAIALKLLSFDSEITTAIYMEVSVQGLYENVLPVNSNTVVTVAQNGFLIVVDTGSGNIDITLPDLSLLSADFRIGVAKGTGDTNQVNVKRAGADTINGAAVDIVQTVQFKIIVYVGDQSTLKYIASDLIVGGGGGITLDTPQATTSGTQKDFTGIPAGTKQITVIFNEVSMSATADMKVQIGPVGGIETTGYISTGTDLDVTPAFVSATDSFIMNISGSADVVSGHMILTLIDESSNTWISSHTGKLLTNSCVVGGGSKSLAGELSQVRILTQSGSFDNGQVNIQFQ